MKRDFRGARTYRLQPTTIERVDRQTAALGCRQSDLVDLLLQRALEQVESGIWPMDRTATAFDVAWSEA